MWGRVQRFRQGLHSRLRGPFALWYDARYRLPLASIEAQTRLDPRRADLAVGFLLDRGFVRRDELREPRRIRYRDLARVHEASYLESLTHADELARIFAVDASDVPVDEVLTSLRLATGATLAAARFAMRHRCPAMNLLGGFHHAGPARGGGFCAVNDIAVAIASLRAEGFEGRVAVLDLDAHPPDGLVECLVMDQRVWIGSISGSDWGPLEGADETRLAEGSGDATYLEALRALLKRMPESQLSFVIAGGDVLAGDRFGALGLSLQGVRARDQEVLSRLLRVPSVWLPGGGYSSRAWRALAGTATVITHGSLVPIPAEYDSLHVRFAQIARAINPARLSGGSRISEADLMLDLGLGSGQRRFLDYYTQEGLEYVLERYGLLPHLRRLGYGNFRVTTDATGQGDRLRLFGVFDGLEYLLIECVLEKRWIDGAHLLYVHWLTLRHPRGRFSEQRPRLPGQEQPGLGLAREAGEMLVQAAQRLGLAGLAFTPAWLHTAYAARHHCRFMSPERQGRFEALLRDLRQIPLLELSRAVAEGRVLLNGERYAWEATDMVHWLREHPEQMPISASAARAAHFELASGPGVAQ